MDRWREWERSTDLHLVLSRVVLEVSSYSMISLLSHACHGFSPQVGVIFRGREVGQARMGSGKHGPRGGGASGDIPGVILTHSGSENRRNEAAVMLVGVPSRGWTGRRSRYVRTVQRPERGQDV